VFVSVVAQHAVMTLGCFKPQPPTLEHVSNITLFTSTDRNSVDNVLVVLLSIMCSNLRGYLTECFLREKNHVLVMQYQIAASKALLFIFSYVMCCLFYVGSTAGTASIP